MAEEIAVVPEVLTAIESKQLASLEAKIEKGLTSYFEVGNALRSIRDEKLYRASHGTFEDYVRSRWDMVGRRAYQLIDAADVRKNIVEPETKDGVPLTPPEVEPNSERVVRPISKLETPHQQRVAWNEAIRTAPRDKEGRPIITSDHVQAVVENRINRTSIDKDANGKAETTKKKEPEMPWSEFDSLLDPDLVQLKNIRRRLTSLFDFDEEGKPKEKYAQFITKSGSVDLLRDLIKHIEDNRPGAKHREDPGYIPVRVVKDKERAKAKKD